MTRGGTAARRRLGRAPAVLASLVIAVAAGFAAGRWSGTDEERPTWRPLPAAPIPGRAGAAAVWTGREVLVWGGRSATVTRTPGRDGAAFDPARRTWRRIAPAPAGVEGGAGTAVWTGSEMLVWASSSPDGPVGAAAYDPNVDHWRTLPPGPLGRREGYVSVWTGSELVVVGGTLGDTRATPVAAALDPRRGSWRPLHGLDELLGRDGLALRGAVWDGREIVAVAGGCTTGDDNITSCRSALVAFDPSTDGPRSIALPLASEIFGADTAASLVPFGWSGREVVFTAPYSATSVRIVLYDPTVGGWAGSPGTGCHIVASPAHGRGCRDWRIGPPSPCTLALTGAQTAFLGDRYVAPCGADGIQVFTLATNDWVWRGPTRGASPIAGRGGSALAWTGRDLVVWSGSVEDGGSATPNDGASLRFAP